MPKSEQDKLIDEWIALRNEHIGETWRPPIGEIPADLRAFYGSQMNEYVNTDLIRHWCDGCGERNPLFRNAEYARNTRWGGIIAPVTFIDAISQPYMGWEDFFEHPIRQKIKSIRFHPRGSRRESFQVIRPGDKFRCVDKYLGLKEIEGDKVLRPNAREFDDVLKRFFINQREEVVATYDRHAYMVCNHDSNKSPEYGWVKRHDITMEDLGKIYLGYDEEKRRGPDILYWDDVKVGDKFKLHKIGPIDTWAVVAVMTVLAGHGAAFEVEAERWKAMGPFIIGPDRGKIANPTGNPHFEDNAPETIWMTGGKAVGLFSQVEWVLGRLICNWMGDDGVLKVLDDRVNMYPILGDVLCCSGEVTNKRVAGEEHLVDLKVQCENLDSVIIMSGSSTVQLLSRSGKETI
jgi:hypothetical protein